MEEREKLIRELSARYDMKGFDHSPLEREKVVEFISRLTDSQKRQNAETDRLQVSALTPRSPTVEPDSTCAERAQARERGVQCQV